MRSSRLNERRNRAEASLQCFRLSQTSQVRRSPACSRLLPDGTATHCLLFIHTVHALQLAQTPTQCHMMSNQGFLSRRRVNCRQMGTLILLSPILACFVSMLTLATLISQFGGTWRDLEVIFSQLCCFRACQWMRQAPFATQPFHANNNVTITRLLFERKFNQRFKAGLQMVLL